MKLKTETVYAYYDYPMVFSALNEDGNIFVCLFADETETHLRYLCKEVSSSVLADLECNRMDIRSVFEPRGKLYSLCVNAQSEGAVEAVETSEDIAPFLPEKDFFVGILGTHESRTPRIMDMPIPPHPAEFNYSFATPAYYASSPAAKYLADTDD